MTSGAGSLRAGCLDCSGCSVATSKLQTSSCREPRQVSHGCRSDLPAGLRRRAEFYRRELLPPHLLARCTPMSSLLPRCWPRILPDKCDAQMRKTADLCLHTVCAGAPRGVRSAHLRGTQPIASCLALSALTFQVCYQLLGDEQAKTTIATHVQFDWCSAFNEKRTSWHSRRETLQCGQHM